MKTSGKFYCIVARKNDLPISIDRNSGGYPVTAHSPSQTRYWNPYNKDDMDDLKRYLRVINRNNEYKVCPVYIRIELKKEKSME